MMTKQVRKLAWRTSVLAWSFLVLQASAGMGGVGNADAQAQTLPPSPASAPTPAAAPTDWRETYAYSLGMQAYVFGFPWAFLADQRWQRTNPAGKAGFKAPMNQFAHSRELRTASHRLGGTPNNDTVYSFAWLDVSKEPLILSHPDMGKPYFTFEIAGFDSDNFAYVGTRTTGSKAGHYAIVGPHWKGKLPKGVKALPPSPTHGVIIFGRMLIDGPEDLPRAHALQDALRLTPLSQWNNPKATVATPGAWKVVDEKADPLGFWKNLSRAWGEDPPQARHSNLLAQFKRIGVGPGLNVEQQDEATKRGLARAVVDGRKLLQHFNLSGGALPQKNGWVLPVKPFGRAGVVDDFLLRAGPQCLGGIISNDPEEAMYIYTFKDGDGKMLEGGKAYTLRFTRGQLPKVNAFWSLSMYDHSNNFVDNPINRYALGDRSRHLKPDADGSLTIHMQPTSPGPEKEGNWLPSPANERFYVVLRAYLPDVEVSEGRWAPPAIQTQ